MGAPTEDMLKKCTEIAKTATAHRMVGSVVTDLSSH